MRKLLSMLALCSLASASVLAQAPSAPISLYAGGLFSYPQGPDAFKESYETGYHMFAGIGLKASPMFQIIGKAELNNFGFDFANNSMDDYDGGQTKLLMFGADGRMSFGAPVVPVKPFIFGGLGMANISYDEFTGGDPLSLSTLNSSVPEDQNKLYYNFGGGVELKASPMFSFFAQIRYVTVQTDENASSFVPISLGLKFF